MDKHIPPFHTEGKWNFVYLLQVGHIIAYLPGWNWNRIIYSNLPFFPTSAIGKKDHLAPERSSQWLKGVKVICSAGKKCSL